jgi:hypothetical protein
MIFHPGPPVEHLHLDAAKIRELDEAWGSIVGRVWSEAEVTHWLAVSEHAVLDGERHWNVQSSLSR